LAVLGQMDGRGSIIVDGTSVVLSGRVANEQVKAGLLRTISNLTAYGLELEDHVLAASNKSVSKSGKGTIQARIEAILARSSIEFTSNVATLTPKGMTTLNTLIPILQEDPHATIEIAGHTDAFGTPEYNMDLSQQRADTVRQFFVTHGLTNRFIAIGYGATKPRTAKQTKTALQRNRRIELRVIENGAP
jgi:OOP family OmpA-OmpF porin